MALCLRLAWPAPVPTSPNADLAATLGEHALCLAAAAEANGQPADAPQPGDHADHDGLGCCQWHATAGFVLPPVAALVRVVYQPRALVPSVVAQTPPARYSTGSGQARAPPALKA